MATHSQMQKEPHNIHQAHMEKVCEICGDIGYKEASITCYWCKNVGVHQYRVLGYYEDAPVDWCCEECGTGKGAMFSSRGPENENSEGSKSNASAKICQSGSTILEHRSSDAVNESRRMNSSATHPCDPALVPSWKSQTYIALVEFMRINDLVMRTVINDVELLILASTTLCSDSQRWNDEHFLWGLFCHMEQDTDGCAEGGSNKVIDMEIDMIAGENVGTLDIVVSTADRNGFDTVVTPQADLENTSAATMDTHTQQESGVLRKSKRVRTPSTRLTDFVVEVRKGKVVNGEHLI